MKYYIGAIETRNGDMDSDSVVKFKTKGDPDKYLDKLTKSFWGDCHRREDEWYWFGDHASRAGELKEITKELYEALPSPFIVELRTK
jgi:hypothetical protein